MGAHEIDRLDKYLQYKGINDNEFTVSTRISNGWIGKAREKKSAITPKTRNKILNTYKDLNEIWLMTGTGEMIAPLVTSKVTSPISSNTDQSNKDKTELEYWKMLAEFWENKWRDSVK